MNPVPASLQNGVDIILASFPENELRAWAAQPEDIAKGEAHFGLGMWIRNNWVHGSGSPLSARIRDAAGFIHDDGVSSVIVAAVWHVLNGQPCPAIEELVKPSAGMTPCLDWN